MTIDLMALAKKADETYRDVELSFGTLRVYHVPSVRLFSIGPDRPEPQPPIVRMKTATGFQDRPATPKDPEFQEYQRELTAYNEERIDLQIAIGTVLALRDIDWSQYDLSQPPPNSVAQEMYNGSGQWPENEYIRKKAWLDWTVLVKSSDATIISDAIREMNGLTEPTEDGVEEVKKNSD